MDLRQSLANSFAASYPQEAAAALETRPAEEIAQVLRGLTPDTAAAVLRLLSPVMSARSIEQLDTLTAAGIFAELETDDAVPLLRRVTSAICDAIIQALPAEQATAVNTVLRFPAGTAGALMDPRAVALPGDLEVNAALQAVRREAEHVHYHLYIVDREGRLAGVLNLQGLLRARPKDRLDTIMQQTGHLLSSSADRYAIAGHRGWREVQSLPVVDGDGRLLGAIHHRVLRALEDELHQPGTESGDTAARALGDLFWTGVGGVIDALAAAVAPRERRPTARFATPPTGERRSNGVSDGPERQSNGEE